MDFNSLASSLNVVRAEALASVTKASAYVGELAQTKEPTFDDACEKALRGIGEAQKALCDAVSLAPSDAHRGERRQALGALHQNLDALASTLRSLKDGPPLDLNRAASKSAPEVRVPKVPAPREAPHSPHSPPTVVVADLLSPAAPPPAKKVAAAPAPDLFGATGGGVAPSAPPTSHQAA